MTEILKADGLYDKILEKLKKKIADKNISPVMSIIRFGKKDQDLAYERGIKKSAEKLNIEVRVEELDVDTSQEEVLNLIEKINKNEKIGGLLVFRPIPQGLEEEKINSSIGVDKDIDCMNPINKAKVYSGDISGFLPLSPKASVELLNYYNMDLEGKNCLIINHSNVVGKPLSMILLAKWATVTIAHIRTKNLKELSRNADYIFTAIGKAQMLDESYFNENAIVIDIGLSRNSEGKMRGDLDFKSVDGKISAYSPVPGGVGKITNLLLLENLVNYYM
ncbi:MAG: bifunctional 5,10-methylenetetrahydrofolate dehydrogenase/5,10-methenyltetrahydrofolate cyclohydrolase [Peptoniphilaceae bacterium]